MQWQIERTKTLTEHGNKPVEPRIVIKLKQKIN